MKCKACRQRCKDEGGLCGPLDYEEAKAVDMAGMDAVNAADTHKATEHGMTLGGALWQCAKGHDVDAAPADVMRGAGVRPML